MAKSGRKRGRAVAGRAAEAAGFCLRAAPGVAGPLLVAYGLWLAWPPLGFVVAGAALLLADRRLL